VRDEWRAQRLHSEPRSSGPERNREFTSTRHWSSVAKALSVLLGSLEDEIVSNHPNPFVPECGAFVTGTIDFRIAARQSHLSALKPVGE
jgi:hypothetical protein